MSPADLEHLWESYSTAIIFGFVILFVAAFVFKARGLKTTVFLAETRAVAEVFRRTT